MQDDLEAILKYGMTQLEAKAYKMALMWQKYCEKEFPGERHTKLKKTGDPRNSNLFRYCYKLAVETKGLIPDQDYRLYITAQLQILKTLRDGEMHALIEPQILVGDKAWRRWKLWKAQYDKKMSQPKNSDDVKLFDGVSKIIAVLAKTKEFLTKQGLVTYDFAKERMDDLSLIRWITTGKVSPYYVILSPWVEKWLAGRNLEEVFKFDLKLYRPSITPALEESFRKEFSIEFDST